MASYNNHLPGSFLLFLLSCSVLVHNTFGHVWDPSSSLRATFRPSDAVALPKALSHTGIGIETRQHTQQEHRTLFALKALRGGCADHGEQLVVGVDGGTESIRAAVFSSDGRIIGMHSAAYVTTHPKAGYAEQSPAEWWERMGEAVRGALAQARLKTGDEHVAHRICAICVDTTCCTVVALDKGFEPLRPALLWMDARSSQQAQDILTMCADDGSTASADARKWLKVNCDGEGPLSAEWMLPKSLWLKLHERHVWDQATTVCEYQDFINYKLTGVMCASNCNAASRWHWDGEEASHTTKTPGRPIQLLQRIGLVDLADKWPQTCIPMGSKIGGLTAEAAAHLGLHEATIVAQGGADAFVGMLGLGCIKDGQLSVITGSSHLHLAATSKPNTAPGVWGAYRGAPLLGMCFAEGGQSSTGSILRWLKALMGNHDNVTYKDLDAEAAAVPRGCDGLYALETFQGSRTPVTDPLARGALVGLTLSHTRAHIWRAYMEAVCFGTRACVESLGRAGHVCTEMLVAGGATRSETWLQMHADVCGLPAVVCECTDGPLLGCAVLAAAAAGLHGGDVRKAVHAMVRQARRVEPNQEAHVEYTRLFQQRYSHLGPALRSLRAQQSSTPSLSSSPSPSHEQRACASTVGHSPKERQDKREDGATEDRKEGEVIISPSLLACDWGNIQREVDKCAAAGVKWLHLDVFDGVEVDSPDALSFGPKMVKCVRAHAHGLILDVHLVAQRPLRYMQALAMAGADVLTLQWESLGAGARERCAAFKLAAAQGVTLGVQVGICLAVPTPVSEIAGLIKEGLVPSVNVLAVNTGFGGQGFQSAVLPKLQELRALNVKQRIVDGGINAQTAKQVVDAGANVLVAGTYVFGHAKGVSGAMSEINSVII